MPIGLQHATFVVHDWSTARKRKSSCLEVKEVAVRIASFFLLARRLRHVIVAITFSRRAA